MVRRSANARTYSWYLLAFLLLLCVSLSIADDTPKKKSILDKVLGRFQKKDVKSDADIVEPETSVDVKEASETSGKEESAQDNEMCASDDQTCAAKASDENAESEVADTPIEEKANVVDESDADKANEEKAPGEPDNGAPNSDTEKSIWEMYIPEGESAPEEIECKDRHENCATWASQTDQDGSTPCKTNLAYMSIFCPVSCNTCELVDVEKRLREFSKNTGAHEGQIHPLCSDDDFNCISWAEKGECDTNKAYMVNICRSACGLCSAKSNFFGSGQRTVNNKSQDQVLTLARIDETVKYMEMVNSSPEYKNVRANCINRDRDCAFWWAVGECAINKEYMDLFCAPTCQTCHMIIGFDS